MAKSIWRAARAAALLGLSMGGCASESDELDAAPPPERGQVSYALEGEGYAAAPDAGSPARLCVNELAALTPVECAACAQEHCAPEAASCGESCGQLITCAAANCAPGSISCIAGYCSECTVGATTANNYAVCLDEHCASACPEIASLAIPPSPPPPPPPPGACDEDLPGALGAECAACIESECIDQGVACDETCRSLITCVVEVCGSGENLSCVLGSCGACIGGVTAVQTLDPCIVERCAAECPPIVGSPDQPDEPDAGAAPAEHPHKHKHHHHHHHPRGPRNRGGRR